MNNMGYRNITVSDEVYEELSVAKKEKESFNSLLHRWAAERKPKATLESLRGAWVMTDKEEKEFKKSLKEGWSRWNERIGHEFPNRSAQKPRRDR